MSERLERCEVCKFWTSSGSVGYKAGHCRKAGPLPTGGFMTISGADWCGAFEPSAKYVSAETLLREANEDLERWRQSYLDLETGVSAILWARTWAA